MNTNESPIVIPVSCPFYRKGGRKVDDKDQSQTCVVDNAEVSFEHAIKYCRGKTEYNSGQACCSVYSQRVYDDTMSAIRQGITEGIKAAVEKDPERFLQGVLQPKEGKQ